MVKDIFKGYKREFINKGDHYLVKHWREGETKPQFIETITKEQYKELIGRYNSPEHKLMMEAMTYFWDKVTERIPLEDIPKVGIESIEAAMITPFWEWLFVKFLNSPAFQNLDRGEKLEEIESFIHDVDISLADPFYEPIFTMLNYFKPLAKKHEAKLKREIKKNSEVEVFKEKLTEMGFFELKKVKELTGPQQRKLIDFLFNKPKNYTVPFFDYLELFYGEKLSNNTSSDKEKYKLVDGLWNKVDLKPKTIKDYLGQYRNNTGIYKDKITKELFRSNFDKIKEQQ